MRVLYSNKTLILNNEVNFSHFFLNLIRANRIKFVIPYIAFMHLVQITDLHIGFENEETNGVDVRNNFIKTLKAITQEEVDALIITGDLCYRAPEIDIYKWIKIQLDATNIPYYLIPGNHDNAKMMSEVFDLKNITDEELFYHEKFENWEALFLDTCPAAMSDQQYIWLEKQLDQLKSNTIIFMHHPPINMDVPFMDNKHFFKDQKKFQTLLSIYPFTFEIFCGHYHVEKRKQLQNLNVHVCPSLFFQIKNDQANFEVDHYRIGYNKIHLKEGSLFNEIIYL